MRSRWCNSAFVARIVGLWTILELVSGPVAAEDRWPALPSADATVVIPAQGWPHRPGNRSVEVSVYYPDGTLGSVSESTGLMLTLHNWGGTECVGTADPRQLARRYNVVALCVNYLQSGRPSIEGPEPYDFGYLQSLDALRALYFAFDGLKSRGPRFHRGRIYATGGSGGGNVALMCNKLAPRTFACVVDLCGMKQLSDDVAFNLPGGSDLDARWSRDPASPYYLSSDGQELRFVGCPEHLETMRRLGNSCRTIIVHGCDDTTCPFADARDLAEQLRQARLDVEPHFIRAEDVDGQVFTSTGHALGDRTRIVFRVADPYLLPDSLQRLTRTEPCDFERRDELVHYRTSNGRYVISYKAGYPTGRFEPATDPVLYEERQDLTYRNDAAGRRHPVRSTEDWELRRRQVLASLQQVMGRLPGPTFRVPLDVRLIEQVTVGDLVRRKISYQSDSDDRVSAYLFLPKRAEGARLPAVLCLHQTTQGGKDEPAGLAGNPDLHYALELAQRGYVTLVPDYPSFGEHPYDFDSRHGYSSGSMKAVWDNLRAIDLLETLDEVDAGRIGCMGHSLGGHSALFTAVFEPRIRAIVSSCGFTRFHKDDVPSWTGPRYMPRIASQFQNDADKLPFDFTEIVAALAPRPFLACAAQRDDDFDVSGVQDVMTAARTVYELYGQADALQAHYPDCEHAFPPQARKVAYEFLDKHLRH